MGNKLVRQQTRERNAKIIQVIIWKIKTETCCQVSEGTKIEMLKASRGRAMGEKSLTHKEFI